MKTIIVTVIEKHAINITSNRNGTTQTRIHIHSRIVLNDVVCAIKNSLYIRLPGNGQNLFYFVALFYEKVYINRLN